MEERLISLTLLGQEFSFYSDAPEEEVQEAIALLAGELKKTGLAERGTNVPSSSMLVLAGLRLAARCVNLENEFSAFHTERKFYEERNRLISGIIEQVSSALEG